MIEAAARDLDLDLSRSVMVGDRWLDVACGRAAGVRAVLVRTGHGAARGRSAWSPACEARCYPQQFDGGRRVDSAQLLALVGALKGRRVAVIGDVVADEFVYGRVARVSREAPVLILEYDSTEVVPGAGGNAANNVAALGGHVTLATLVGTDDPASARAASPCTRGVDRRHVVRAPRATTTVKTRILAGGVHSAKQQVVRIDRGVGARIDATGRAAFERRALRACARRGRRAGVRLRLGAGDAAAGGRAPRRSCGAPAARRRSWWTRATACCGTAG